MKKMMILLIVALSVLMLSVTAFAEENVMLSDEGGVIVTIAPDWDATGTIRDARVGFVAPEDVWDPDYFKSQAGLRIVGDFDIDTDIYNFIVYVQENVKYKMDKHYFSVVPGEETTLIWDFSDQAWSECDLGGGDLSKYGLKIEAKDPENYPVEVGQEFAFNIKSVSLISDKDELYNVDDYNVGTYEPVGIGATEEEAPVATGVMSLSVVVLAGAAALVIKGKH